MNEILENIDIIESLESITGILLCIPLIVGGIQCFFGYKIFRAVAAIIGFFVGGVIGGIVGSFADFTVAIICFALFGILGAFLAYKLYMLGVFFSCFCTGAVIGLTLAILMQQPSSIPSIMAIIGLLFGIVGVILKKPIIILCTGFSGGSSMGLALGMILKSTLLGSILGIALSIIGIIIQFYHNRETDDDDVTTTMSST